MDTQSSAKIVYGTGGVDPVILNRVPENLFVNR